MGIRLLVISFILFGQNFAHAIVNGAEVAPMSPLARATVSLSGPFYKSFGSGVLIDKRHVLTVYHNYLLVPRTIKVQFGSQAGEGGFRAVVSHTPCTAGSVLGVFPTYHDILILELDSDAPEGFEPAQIASAKMRLAPGTHLTTAGFGLEAPSILEALPTSPDTSGTLRAAEASFVQYSSDPTEFETAPIINQAGPSFGDSGGPVFLADEQNRPLLSADGQLIVVGLVERGLALPFDGRAGMENVGFFQDWILRNSQAKIYPAPRLASSK